MYKCIAIHNTNLSSDKPHTSKHRNNDRRTSPLTNLILLNTEIMTEADIHPCLKIDIDCITWSKMTIS